MFAHRGQGTQSEIVRQDLQALPHGRCGDHWRCRRLLRATRSAGRASHHDHTDAALHSRDCPQSGEDFLNPESSLACLEVFALSPQNSRAAAKDSAYYATRTALAQVTREAVSYVTQKGMAKESAPALLSFVSRIASRFGLEVSEKVAAEMVPVAGAVGGLTLNVLFSQHFQSLAEGHFIVRRLERKYGSEAVRQDYELVRSST